MTLLRGTGFETTDGLFDFVGQAIAALLGGEQPDQNPSQQHQHGGDLEESREALVRLDSFKAGAVGGIAAIKEADDPEKRAIQEIYPFGILFLHRFRGRGHRWGLSGN